MFSAQLVRASILVVALGQIAPAQSAPIPPRLIELVMGSRRQPVESLKLGEVAFDAISPLYEHPLLMWRHDAAQRLPFETTPQAVELWLEGARASLGLEGFDLFFSETSDWRGNTIWRFGVESAGVVVIDARIDVHLHDGELEGLLQILPGDIESVEPAPNDAAREWVYFARRAPSRTDLELGWIERETTAEGEVMRIVDETGLQWTRITPPVAAPAELAAFTEWVVPNAGSFPDQIAVGIRGEIWFSQPNQGRIVRFEPSTTQFTFFSTGGGTPDGLSCDPNGNVWTGLYTGNALGRFVTATSQFTALAAPYTPNNLAIPFPSRNGRIYVTDHQNNKVAVWNPSTSTWGTTIPMPTPNCWVTAATEDVGRQTLYFTEYYGNKLGKLPWAGTMSDIVVPGGGPAFLSYHNNRVWYSEWLTSKLGSYNVVTGQVVEYNFPAGQVAETGGPLGTRRDGKVIVGTRNRGYLMVFDPAASTFTPLPIPTVSPGLKDGLTVTPTGDVWFTESGVNKIARYVF